MRGRAELRTRIYQLLTADQRAQLTTLQAQRNERVQWIATHRPEAPSDK
ncbi:MAG TPA: hypothetical protein VFQ88_03845 [Nevskiaceae bacterium]|nr:hypothetical protein [Nevskiaceae bacterium]